MERRKSERRRGVPEAGDNNIVGSDVTVGCHGGGEVVRDV